jgi:hypothetical protein
VKGIFRYKKGGSSRTLFVVRANKNVQTVAGLADVEVSMTSAGFTSAVVTQPVHMTDGLSSTFSFPKYWYSTREMSVDAYLLKRMTSQANQDLMRMILSYESPDAPFDADNDTLEISIEGKTISIGPNQWTVNRAAEGFLVFKGQQNGEDVILKMNTNTRSISVIIKKANLSAIPTDPNIELSFGGSFFRNRIQTAQYFPGSKEINLY